jgi:ADP-heptose:LPS heptosyltransferase
MHSTTRVVGQHGELVAKDWSPQKWQDLAEELYATLGFDIVAIGAESDRGLSSPYVRNLYGLPITVIAALLRDAACVVTVENGLMHLCHAVDAPMVVIFSKYVPFAWSNPREASRACILHDDPVSISSSDVAAAVKAKVQQDASAT